MGEKNTCRTEIKSAFESMDVSELNNFIGGRSKQLTEIVDANELPAIPDRSDCRVILDAYGRWKLVKCSSINERASTSQVHSCSSQSQRSKIIPILKTSGSESTLSSSRSSRQPSLAGDPIHHDSEGNDSQEGTKNNKAATPRTCSKIVSPTNFTKESYEELSAYTRFNTLPGKGNTLWRTTFEDAYRGRQITPPWQSGDFHGIKTDGFMKWVESNVCRQKMLRKWGKYEEEIKKKEGAQPPLITPKHVIQETKVEEPRKAKPIVKPKKSKFRKIADKKEEGVNLKDNPQNATIIEVKPQSSSDAKDDFWDFYDRPFK